LTAALDLLLLGRLRDPADWLARSQSITAGQLREAFSRMLAAGPALAISGRVARGTRERAHGLLAAQGVPGV
jgi:hypothetical protein